MNDWRQTLLEPERTVREAIACIDRSALQIALVVGPQQRLLGTVTDGDVRRAILRGSSLDAPVSEVMNKAPTVAQAGEDLRTRLPEFRTRQIHRIPIVDAAGSVVGLQLLEELAAPQQRDNCVVLMAGGLGARLRPLTDECPKPMLRIGERPILETILLGFIEQGFHDFYISINYMGEMVRSHFGDGSRWGVRIRYLEEDQRLGTAGALSLLPARPQLPFFVMNGDILAKVNYQAMLDFHAHAGASASVGVRQITHAIPYGVVRLDGHKLVDIVEKPQEKLFVSAGIYLLAPQVLDLVPGGSYFDMPTLLQALVGRGELTAGFPIHEYWLDIGRMEDYARAHEDFGMTFQ
ncbi:alcohol dehydrogenase [Ramlibacter sp. G-1-2-2]|uniref:Alcohol dehydrogenase n=1 Tax=Ramlibacter agri TaxID=2728837 RepID=A0A848H7V5_9BURK|nr:alcohol dehydrogenase [Ramlibacter agri]